MAIQIRGGQIKSATITGTQLATGSIDNANLFGSAVVVASALAADSVTSAKIANGAIDDTAYLANSVVTAAKINLTGSFDFSSGTLRSASPSADSDVATKAYVDAASEGLHWKKAAKCASTANVDISSAPATIDGVSLSADDRVLLKDQTTASQSGIYIWASAGSAMTRADDADSAEKLSSAAIFVQQGSVNADMGYTQTATLSDLNSNQTWTQFTGLGQVVAGDGLQKNANTLSVDLSANSGMQITSGELELNVGNGLQLSGGAVSAKINGSTLALDAGGLKVGTITSGEIGANAVTSAAIAAGSIDNANKFAAGVVDSSALAANSVVEAKLASGSVSLAKLAANSVDENKIKTSVAGSGLSGGGGSALSVDVDDSSIEVGGSGLNIKANGIAAAMLQSASVESAKVAANAIVSSKIGARFYQEGFQIANGTTSTLDLARALDSNFFSSVQVVINGLAANNNTALGSGAPSDNTEYQISNNGAGSVGRCTFGANLIQGDAVIVKYFT